MLIAEAEKSIMASASTGPTPAARPQPLPDWQRVLCKIGLFVGAILVCVGIGGILVVTGVLSFPACSNRNAIHVAARTTARCDSVPDSEVMNLFHGFFVLCTSTGGLSFRA